MAMAESPHEYVDPSDITKEDVISAFLQTIQRTINCLSAEEAKIRRTAIERLHIYLLKDDAAGSLPPADVLQWFYYGLQALWDGHILDRVMRCVCDPTEKCREVAIQLIREVAQSLTEVDFTLKEIVRVMALRMGQAPVLEDSEEIRLQLFSLLNDILLPECEISSLQTIIDPLHRILTVTLYDNFHEVRKSACRVLVTTANRDPDVFGNRIGTLLKALIPCLSHSHSRVRIAVFQAIDAMVQCGLTASVVAQQLAPGIKFLAFDHTTTVRELFFASVANWLNYNLRKMNDEEIRECIIAGKVPRFHIAELLPLLLLGLTDECLDIARSTYEKIEGVGEIYKKFIDQLNKFKAPQGREDVSLKSLEEGGKFIEVVLGDRDAGKSTWADTLILGSAIREVPIAESAKERTVTQNAKELGEHDLEQAMKDFTHRSEAVEYEKSHAPECSFVTKVESSEETAEKGAFNTVPVKKKTWTVGGMERIGKEETCKENSEVTAEAIFDPDLKDYNVHPERSKIPPWYAALSRSGSQKSQTSWKETDLIEGDLSVEWILDSDLRIFNKCQELDNKNSGSDPGQLWRASHALGIEGVEIIDGRSGGLEEVQTNSVHGKEIIDGRSGGLEEVQTNSVHGKISGLDVNAEAHPWNETPGISVDSLENKEEGSTAGDKDDDKSEKYVSSNQVRQEDEHKKAKTIVSLLRNKALNKVTSVITNEGAVLKKDSGEAGVETLQLPIPYRGRPSAGCQLMVEAFLRSMIKPCLKELKQWTAPTRLSAARLLHTLMIFAEGFAEDNLDILIPAFCSAVGDDDVKVAKRVVATTHIVGFYVPPKKWLPLVLKPLGNIKTSDAQRAHVLVVTAALLYGTPRKAMEEEHVEQICEKLYGKEVCCSEHSSIQNQLLSVVNNLVQVAGALCTSSSFNIFIFLLRLQLQSVEGDYQLQQRAGHVLKSFAQVLRMKSVREFYVQHIHSMLDIVTADHKRWSSGSPGNHLFQTFMRNADDTVGPYLKSLMPLFRVCLQNNQDPVLRFSFLQTEAAIRCGAMVAVGTFLKKDLCSQIHTIAPRKFRNVQVRYFHNKLDQVQDLVLTWKNYAHIFLNDRHRCKRS
nr:dynein assembly factor 5, axonemal-like isoform X10 [Physcomitrium patens]|eukprot:XP_024382371.1 dynein assembly factor 5, axonemal-like isoform X10 [Physcomitrella patens]